MKYKKSTNTIRTDHDASSVQNILKTTQNVDDSFISLNFVINRGKYKDVYTRTLEKLMNVFDDVL